MGAGGGKSKKQTIGYKYFMSLHQALCRGPIDEIVQIDIGGKKAFPLLRRGQTETIKAPGTYRIEAELLFGGEKREGGVKGNLQVLMGGPSQILPEWIKRILPPDPPAFRGVTSLFFDGLICAMNPYPKPWKFRVRRALAGWDGPPIAPDLAKITMGNTGAVIGYNGAHIIYECATNRAWGRGLPREMIDLASFEAAAQTLYNEGFGLCLKYNRKTEIDDFVGTVVQHIGASIFTHRGTGLLTLKLIRKDYTPSEVPLFTYTSGLLKVPKPERVSRENCPNEVIVKFFDPLGMQERSVRAHNLASIDALGEYVTTTMDYPGCPTFGLAARLAERDLNASTEATLRFNGITLDRRGAKLNPGEVFRISAPDLGYENLILRAAKVAESGSHKGEIVVDALIDVFSLPSNSFVDEEPEGWVPPDGSVQAPARRRIGESSWRTLAMNLGRADLKEVTPSECYLVASASKPTSLSLSLKMAVRETGSNFVTLDEQGSFGPSVLLSAGVGPYETVFPVLESSWIEPDLAVVGEAAAIGNEMVRIDAITSTSITVARGVEDTIPQTHGVGASLLFTDSSGIASTVEYTEGESVDVKLLSTTTSEESALTEVPTDTYVFTGRQNRPYPPGNVKLNGVLGFEAANLGTSLTVTWANRNRLTQGDQLIAHTDSNIAPEPLQTTTVEVRVNGVVIRSASGLSGGSWSYTEQMSYDDGDPTLIELRVFSSRDGVRSSRTYAFANLARTIFHTPPALPTAFTATWSSPQTAMQATGGASANQASIQFWRAAASAITDLANATRLQAPVAATQGQVANKTNNTQPGVWDFWATGIGTTGGETVGVGPRRVAVPGEMAADDLSGVVNGTPLGSAPGWERASGSDGTSAGASVVTGGIINFTGNVGAMYWKPRMFTLRQYARAKFRAAAGSNHYFLAVRCVSLNTFVGLYYATNRTLRIAKQINGASTQLANTSMTIPADNDDVELRIDADHNVSALVNGVVRVGPVYIGDQAGTEVLKDVAQADRVGLRTATGSPGNAISGFRYGVST